MRIVFPSGLITDNRPMQGKEILTMASARAKRAPSGGISDVFRACWIATEDPGPYRFVQGNASPDWKRVAAGDVLKGLLDHCIAALGPDISFPMQCKACGKLNEEVWVRLDEFALKALPEESAKRIREGLPLETKLRDGRVVTFDIGSLSAEEYVEAQLKQMRKRPEWADHTPTFIDLMAGRIRSIEGVDNSNEFVKRLEHLLFLDAGQIWELLEQMNEADCGVDTEVEFACQHCGWEQVQDVPLEHTSLFNPKSHRRPKTVMVEGTPKSASTTTAGSD